MRPNTSSGSRAEQLIASFPRRSIFWSLLPHPPENSVLAAGLVPSTRQTHIPSLLPFLHSGFPALPLLLSFPFSYLTTFNFVHQSQPFSYIPTLYTFSNSVVAPLAKPATPRRPMMIPALIRRPTNTRVRQVLERLMCYSRLRALEPGGVDVWPVEYLMNGNASLSAI